jgi:hypothetical protein
MRVAKQKSFPEKRKSFHRRVLISPFRAGIGTGRSACAEPVAEASSGLFPQPLWMSEFLKNAIQNRRDNYI